MEEQAAADEHHGPPSQDPPLNPQTKDENFVENQAEIEEQRVRATREEKPPADQAELHRTVERFQSINLEDPGLPSPSRNQDRGLCKETDESSKAAQVQDDLPGPSVQPPSQNLHKPILSDEESDALKAEIAAELSAILKIMKIVAVPGEIHLSKQLSLDRRPYKLITKVPFTGRKPNVHQCELVLDTAMLAWRKAEHTPAAGDEDRIGALPDDVLRHLLSFLPSRDAVRTSVLAARWRTLWKSVPAVRINDDYMELRSAYAFNKFANYLIFLRDRIPLLECDIEPYSNDYYHSEEAFLYAEVLSRYAISCQARVLRVYVRDDRLKLPNLNFVSKHLTRLEVYNMEFRDSFLDFWGCPALQVLKMEECGINAENILSKSLRELSIMCCYFSLRTWISAPILIALIISDCTGSIPLLRSFSSLETAFIRIDGLCGYHCYNYSLYGDCDNQSCFGCYTNDGFSGASVFLEGFSGVTNLELMRTPPMFILRNDFRWRPIFSKLKTLLLNVWCLAAGFRGLVYFLKHSPVLERLTLQLPSYMLQHVIQTDESYSPREQFMVSKHLKLVEIQCDKADEKLRHILKILITHGVLSKNIIFQSNFMYYDSFSFELW